MTDWPSSLTVAASWDTAVLKEYGAALAKEQRRKGKNVMLGPGLNLARVPQCEPSPSPFTVFFSSFPPPLLASIVPTMSTSVPSPYE